MECQERFINVGIAGQNKVIPRYEKNKVYLSKVQRNRTLFSCQLWFQLEKPQTETGKHTSRVFIVKISW